MKKISLRLFLIIISLLGLCLPVNSGRKEESFNAPQRIVSLSPPITESLYLLGVQDRLIANTTYCIRPKAAKDKEKIGDTMRLNLEEVVNLKPDLVLATSLSNTKQTERLKDLGIRVITFSNPGNFLELCQQFLELGKIVGREKKAEEIVSQAKEKVSFALEKVKNLPGLKILVQIGAKPLWVAPKDSFINDLIQMAGGINVGPSGKSGLYSLEEVLLQNPDVIIIAEMGIVGQEERKAWQKYKTIKAVKNKRIHFVDTYKLCSPTPVTFGEALEEILKILYEKKRTNSSLYWRGQG